METTQRSNQFLKGYFHLVFETPEIVKLHEEHYMLNLLKYMRQKDGYICCAYVLSLIASLQKVVEVVTV